MSEPNYEDLKDALAAAAPVDFPSVEALKSRSGAFAMMFQRLFEKAGIAPRGVIHLGGHIGNDLAAWMLLGIKSLLLVEPNPKLFRELQRNIQFVQLVSSTLDSLLDLKPTAVHAVQLAIGDRVGTVELTVPEANSEFGSVLGERLEHAGDRAAAARYIVEMKPLDALMADLRGSSAASDYNVLYMNIEGAELMALRGATRTLEHVDFVYLEANTKQNYPDNPTPEQIAAFLDDHGFRLGFQIAGGPPDTVYCAFWRPRGPSAKDHVSS